MDLFGTFLSTMAEERKTPSGAEPESARVWSDVGNALYDAMILRAEEIGGEEFRDEIATAALTDSWLIPNAEALIMLENRQPGSAKETVRQAEQSLLGKLAASS